MQQLSHGPSHPNVGWSNGVPIKCIAYENSNGHKFFRFVPWFTWFTINYAETVSPITLLYSLDVFCGLGIRQA